MLGRGQLLSPELSAAELAKTRKKETVRKMIVHLAMIFDHENVQPNPARGARLPFEQKRELQPPTADHIEAVHRLLPSRYRLPLLTLDATGMRLGELEGLTWGDVDEQRGRCASRRPSRRRAAPGG